MDVGTEIRRARETKGWSQAKLAAGADMGVSGISQIETGTRNPSVVTLSKIAEALEVEVADLFPKGQAPLPLDHAPSLEDVHVAAGCTTDWLLKPADEWYAAFRAETREQTRDTVIRIARQVQDEFRAVEPDLVAAMQADKVAHPETPSHRLSSHKEWMRALSRYLEVYDSVVRALAETDDPTDGGRFPPPVKLPEPQPPTEDPGPGARWVRFGLGYVRDFVGMSDEELEELRSKAEEEQKRRSHA